MRGLPESQGAGSRPTSSAASLEDFLYAKRPWPRGRRSTSIVRSMDGRSFVSFMTDAPGRDHVTPPSSRSTGRSSCDAGDDDCECGGYLSTFASASRHTLRDTAAGLNDPSIFARSRRIHQHLPVDPTAALRPEATYVRTPFATAAREMNCRIGPPAAAISPTFPVPTPVPLFYDTGDYEATPSRRGSSRIRRFQAGGQQRPRGAPAATRRPSKRADRAVERRGRAGCTGRLSSR